MTARTYLTFDIGGTKIASAFVTLPDRIHQGKYERDEKPQVQDLQEIPTKLTSGGQCCVGGWSTAPADD